MKYEDGFASQEARRIYEEGLRRMTPSEKLAMVRVVQKRMHELALAGIRLDYPEYTEQQLEAEYQRRLALQRS